MKLLNAFTLMVTLSLVSHASFAKTIVNIAEQAISFSETPRITDVLAHITNEDAVYWPAVALYEESTELRQLQQKVIKELNALSQLNVKPPLAELAVALANDIESWTVAQRSPYAIHFERARLVPSLNPRLREGEFYLSLPGRNTQLPVWGATSSPNIAFAFKQQMVDIYQQLALPTADSSFIWLVEPDGTIVKVGIAYWNKQVYFSRPGQQLFIPFAASQLPAAFQNLNNDIVTLLRHRVISA